MVLFDNFVYSDNYVALRYGLPRIRHEVVPVERDVVLAPPGEFRSVGPSFQQQPEPVAEIVRLEGVFRDGSGIEEPAEPRAFRFFVHLVREFAGRDVVFVHVRREGEGVQLADAAAFHERPGRFEVLLGLAGKPDDQIRADLDIHAVLPFEGFQPFQCAEQGCAGIVPAHSREYRVRSGLDGEVDVGVKPGIFEPLDQRVREEFHPEAGDPQSFDSRIPEDRVDEFREFSRREIVGSPGSPGADVDARQDDFFASLAGIFRDFRHDVLRGPVRMPAPRLYRQAEGAKIIASRLDYHGFPRGIRAGDLRADPGELGFEAFRGQRERSRRLFGKELDPIPVRQQFRVLLEKTGIRFPVSERTAAGNVQFFLVA